jgi:hypothetical protein
MRVFQIQHHEKCDAESSGGLSSAARRVPPLYKKYMKYMSAFATTQAPQDHGLQEHRLKDLKANTRKCSSCQKEGHDIRTCPKIPAAGSEPDANASDAVRESYFLHLKC